MELVPIVDEIRPDVDTNFGYRDTQPAIEMGITVLLAVTSYSLYLAFLCYVFPFFPFYFTPARVLDYTRIFHTSTRRLWSNKDTDRGRGRRDWHIFISFA